MPSHPIDSENWWQIYGQPTTKVQEISVDELAELYSKETIGHDFVVVDVRRSDMTDMIPGAINLPAQSLPLTLSSLLPSLNHVKSFIFHCNSCKGRGPRAAGWFAEALNDYSNSAESSQDRVYVLTGGIKAWKEKFGSFPLENRGKRWDGKSLPTIEL